MIRNKFPLRRSCCCFFFSLSLFSFASSFSVVYDMWKRAEHVSKAQRKFFTFDADVMLSYLFEKPPIHFVATSCTIIL